MKYILKQIDDISGHNAVTTVEFNTDTLDGVIEHVDLFIRGCGFFPPQGAVLDYIEDDFPDWVGQEDPEVHEWNQVLREDALAEGSYKHSGFYFDTERNK
jgi:hypothetical protein